MTGNRIGKFTPTSDAVQALDQCHAATHTSKIDKKSMTLKWEPADAQEEHPLVVFKATFVESFATFYVGVDSTIDGVSAVKKIEAAMSDSDSEPETDDSTDSPEDED